MTYKACNDKDCASKGILLPEEDFALRAGGAYRTGVCRVCVARKAKARRVENKAGSERAAKSVKSREDKQTRDTNLFNLIQLTGDGDET